MEKVTEQEQKKVCLDLLIYFDEICRKNNIKYSLTGGTLLGAIRHHGFIPWDDDVDVFVPRSEYKKLDKAFKENEKYIWKSRTVDPNYKLVYGRLMDKDTITLNTGGAASEGNGIFLDVCVIDGLPKQRIKRLIQIKMVKFLFRCRRTVVFDRNRVEYSEGNLIKRLFKKVLVLTTDREFWTKKLEKRMQKYPFDESDYVGNFASQYGERELMHRRSFDSYVEVEFEKHYFYACVGWKEYLTNIYGDYMKLPPKEDQIGHHVGNVYWKN